MTENILLAGEGGQGIQTIAEALALAASNQGFNTTYIPSFGVEQRGSPSVAYVIISDKNISYPRFLRPDFCLVLSPRAISSVTDSISLNTKVIFDSSTIDHKLLTHFSNQLMAIPATKYAKEKFHIKSYNVIIYGALLKQLNIDEKKGWEGISEILADKFVDKNIKDLNREAYLFGREGVLERKEFSIPTFIQAHGVNIYKNKDRIGYVNPKYCKGCLICVLKCPVKAISLGSDLGVYLLPVPKIDLEKCIACGNCRKFCPDGAIGVDKLKQLR